MEHRPTILIVDDRRDNINLLAQFLRADDYAMSFATSGLEALESVRRNPPSLILLDVMMPGMDGPSTLQKIRTMAGFETVPVIFMTAKAMPQEVARFRELGAAAVIAKPFDPIQLGNQVVTVWEGLADA